MLGFAALGETALGREDGLVSSDFIAAGSAFTITGHDAGLYATRFMSADAGVFSFAGNDAGLTVARTVTVNTGVFGITFQSAELRKNLRRMSAGGGSRGIAVRPSGGTTGLRIRA